jgi:hypothetical protein
MNLNINLTLDVSGLTLLEFAALADRIKTAVDPFGKRRVVMRLGPRPKPEER